MWTSKEASKKFGILVLCNGIYPNQTGGAEVHLFYMCHNLAERGYHVFVLAPTTKFSSEPSEKNIPFVKIYLKLWSKPFTILSYTVKSLIESFRFRHHVEIVHAHTAHPIPMVAAFLSSLITRRPYIISCRGSDIRISSRKFLHRMFQIPFLHEAKKILVVSHELSEILRQRYGIPKHQILVVENAYDDRIIHQLANIQLGTKAERGKRIINVANMRPEKDHITLLKGFKRLARSMKGVHLSLVGDGPLRGELEEFCIQQGIHNVKFLGTLPHTDVLKHIANSDIFVLTSIEEGMPNVIIEALALGKPIIATAVGGIPEVVKDGVNGILVRPKSPDLIAKALERLLCDSELRRKLGKAAVESVKNRTWSKITEKYERIYKSYVCMHAPPTHKGEKIET